MWTYRQSGFALQLLYELQKQQQGGLHCDTLLQTEDVSVPAHSCVLSALSPVFSRALANTPPLPAGHNRVLSVQAVGTRSLLKLVGFMYTGEMEGEGLVELQEVIDIAHRLGFSTLIDGLKKQMKVQKDNTMRWREIGLQTENTEERKRDASVQIQSEMQSFMHSASQTDSPEAYCTDICPALESVGLSGELASVPSAYHTSPSVIGPDWIKDTTASSSVGGAAVPVNFKCCQQIQKENKERRKVPENMDGLKKIHHRQKLNVEGVQSKPVGLLKSMKGVGGKDYRKLVKKIGFPSSTAFEQQEDAQISLKIKLKRRRGALWEIVSVQKESGVDGSTASGRCQASPRKTHSHSENGATCTQPQKNGHGVPLSPSPANPRPVLGTVTLTPPSDLTLSPPHTPVRNPPSTPLQMPPTSPDFPQAEESDEHIARLLEDMVMMGLNILPSVPMERKSDMHHVSEKRASPEPHLEPEEEQGESFDPAPAPCLCVDGQNLGSGGPDVGKIPSSPGSSAQGEAGSECPGSENQYKCGPMVFKNVTSVASFAIAEDVDPSFMLPCTAPDKVLMSSLPFSTGGLEPSHQNVGELKNVFDNLFWTADDYVQSVKQTKSNTSEENVQPSETATRNAANCDLDIVNTVIHTDSDHQQKPSPEGVSQRDSEVLQEDYSSKIHQELFRQTSDVVNATSSDGGMDLNEMRLPRCLSPLALKEVKTNSFSQKCTELACMSSSLSTSSFSLETDSKHLISSPQTELLPSKTVQQNPCTHPLINLKTASLPSHSSRNLRSSQGCIRGVKKGRHEQVMTQSQSLEKQVFGEAKDSEFTRQTDGSEVKSISTKRYSVDATVDEPNRKKPKMLDFDTNGVEKMAVCTSGEAVQGISTAEQSDYPCAKKTYWLRAGKTVKSESTDQKSKKKLTHVQTNQSCKSKAQDECTENVGEKKSAMVKRGRGRPSTKEKHTTGLQPSKSGHQELQRTENKVNREREENKAQETKIISKAVSDVSLKTEEQKQPSRHPSQAIRKSTVDQVFHQTIFSVGSTVTQCLPSIDEKLRSSSMNTEIAQKTERKRGTGPPLPHILTKFRKLIDQDYMRGRKLIGGKEKKVSTKNGETEEVAKTAEEVMDKSKDRNMDSKNNSEHLGTSKTTNGCLVDRNSEREVGRNEMDKIEEAGSSSIHQDLNANIGSDLHIVPSAGNYGSNSELKSNPQSETAKTCLDLEETSDRTEDIHLNECENTHIVCQEVNQVCEKQQVKENLGMGAVCVTEIPKKNKEHGAERSDVDVEMMEQCALVAAGHGDEAATSSCKTGKEESQPSVKMSKEESVAHEAELRRPLCLRTEVQNISSNEALLHTDPPALTAKEALSVQLGEKPKQTYLSTFNTVDSTTLLVDCGVNIETKDRECDAEEEKDDDEEEKEEEVVVDDLSSSPGILPYSSANRESMTVLTDEEEESEEDEEDVDVTGEDTN